MPYGKPMCLNLSSINLLPGEVFRAVTPEVLPGVRMMYCVSNYGRVVNSHTNRILKQQISVSGYPEVMFCLDNAKLKLMRVHRIEMLTFNPVPNSDELQVNHIDGNKQNNIITNLEWVSPSENIKHAYNTGLATPNVQYGEANHFAKITKDQAVQICYMLQEDNYTMDQIAQLVGTTYGIVKAIKYGECWQEVSKHFTFTRKLQAADDECIHILCRWFQDHPLMYNESGIDHCRRAIMECNLYGRITDGAAYNVYKRKRHANISRNYTF